MPRRPSPGELALLFVGPTVFDDEFLVDTVERLIVQPAGVVEAARPGLLRDSRRRAVPA
jgi:hypothetical protein